MEMMGYRFKIFQNLKRKENGIQGIAFFHEKVGTQMVPSLCNMLHDRCFPESTRCVVRWLILTLQRSSHTNRPTPHFLTDCRLRTEL